MAFNPCLVELLKQEGGYVNDPRDNGGCTNLGVTQHTWEAWIKRPASVVEMRALTPGDVAPLYKARYWDAVSGDALPSGLALCVFDFAVNAGPARAARYLQKLVGTVADGQIGPATLAAVAAYVASEGEPAAVRGYQQMRRTYYHQLSDFDMFGRGWFRRVDSVETAALKLIPNQGTPA